MTLRALTCLVPLLAATSVLASEPEPAPRVPRPAIGELLGGWRAVHGASWRLHVALDTGYLELLAGGKAEPRWTPRDDADFTALAREALAATFAMHGVQDATLAHASSQFLPLGMIGSSDKMTVRFRQVVGGVPVERGFVNVLFDMRGALLSVQSTALPLLDGFATSPALDARRALRRAMDVFVAEQGLVPTTVGEPELVIDQYDVEGERTPRLAWKVDVQHVSDDATPVGKYLYVDAANGHVYRQTNSVHFFDVSGSVSSLTTPGLQPDVAGNPATPQPARFVRVSSGAAVTFSDTNGNFTLPGVAAPASVTFQYANGTYADVQNAAGVAHVHVQTLAAASGNVVVMNSPASSAVTAQANCSRVVPLVRDFIKASNPSDDHADVSLRANASLPGSCSAFYSAGSVNFYQSSMSCPNSAYSTVIAHEEGHWLNDLYHTGNGTDGIGEGNADVWAMYVFDTPIVGASFNNGNFVRTGNNTRPFCGDSNPGCHEGGDIHANGEPWMGAAWKIRNRLNVAFGNASGDLIANSIFLAWMNGYDQGEIKSIIETQWLTLDDDDGTLSNGTPHFAQIDAGFRDQGFPGITLSAIAIWNVTDLPDTQDQNGPYVVGATIQANVSPPIVTATLHYRVEGGSFATIPMTNASGSSWTASIPGIAAPAHVEYYVRATDNAAQSVDYPAGAPAALLDFDVGIVRVLRSHHFDVPGDEGWTHGIVGDASNPTDDWQRATPAGKSGTGWADPAGAYSPSTCWGTDMGLGTSNGAYGADVHAWLRAPVTNCTGATNVRVRFRRWLSVQGSASDQARILVNGQQVYVNPAANLNDGQWIQQEVFLGAIADDNPTVRVEWRIRSNSSTNFGGWNIDDVTFLWLDVPLPPCPTPQNYCSTSPNSVGPGAVLGYQGTPNLSAQNFELIATGLPAGSPGLFFFGTSATQSAFGNGYRCVGGSVYRLPFLVADAFGDAHHLLDYQNVPTPITAGQVWNFQYWYRNPAAGGAGFNLSDGLRVTFCP